MRAPGTPAPGRPALPRLLLPLLPLLLLAASGRAGRKVAPPGRGRKPLGTWRELEGARQEINSASSAPGLGSGLLDPSWRERSIEG